LELNPNHPVSEGIHDHWHKIAFLLMLRMGCPHVEITAEEIERSISGEFGAITVREKGDALHLDLVSWETANRLAREEGGLPN
jgi:hypothetical protein